MFYIVLLLIALLVPDSWTGKVVGVTDGDTITVLVNKTPVKIRLYGIDAPEKKQAFGTASKKYLSGLIFGKIVTVKSTGTDRYGRTIAWIYSGETCINEEMIRAGYAWHYKQFSNEETLASLEQEARTKEKGLWSQPNPTPPWDFRRNGNKESKKTYSSNDYNSYNNNSSDSNSSSSSNDTQTSSSGAYHGNTQSRIFHRSTCRYFNCKNCTAVFNSREEAIQAGYRPCKICKP